MHLLELLRRTVSRRAFAAAALIALPAYGIAAAGALPAARPFAAPAASSTAPAAGVGSLGEVTLALGLVLAAIFGLAWLVRYVRGAASRTGAALDVLAEVRLG